MQCLLFLSAAGSSCAFFFVIGEHFPGAKHEHGAVLYTECAKNRRNANVRSIAIALAARSNASL
jgi:hypothetical protein